MAQSTTKELINQLSYKTACTKCGHSVKKVGLCSKCGKTGAQTPIDPIIEEEEDEEYNEADIQIGTDVGADVGTES